MDRYSLWLAPILEAHDPGQGASPAQPQVSSPGEHLVSHDRCQLVALAEKRGAESCHVALDPSGEKRGNLLRSMHGEKEAKQSHDEPSVGWSQVRDSCSGSHAALRAVL